MNDARWNIGKNAVVSLSMKRLKELLFIGRILAAFSKNTAQFKKNGRVFFAKSKEMQTTIFENDVFFLPYQSTIYLDHYPDLPCTGAPRFKANPKWWISEISLHSNISIKLITLYLCSDVWWIYIDIIQCCCSNAPAVRIPCFIFHTSSCSTLQCTSSSSFNPTRR